MADLEDLPEIDDTEGTPQDTDHGVIEDRPLSELEREQNDELRGEAAGEENFGGFKAGTGSGSHDDTPPVSKDWEHLVDKGGSALADGLGKIGKGGEPPAPQRAPGLPAYQPGLPAYRPGQPLGAPGGSGAAVAVVAVVAVVGVGTAFAFMMRGRRRRKAVG